MLGLSHVMHVVFCMPAPYQIMWFKMSMVLLPRALVFFGSGSTAGTGSFTDSSMTPPPIVV